MAFDKSELMQLPVEEKRALAFELLDSIDEEFVQHEIPEWQKNETLKRLEKMKSAQAGISESDFFNAINNEKI